MLDRVPGRLKKQESLPVTDWRCKVYPGQLVHFQFDIAIVDCSDARIKYQ